jgi:hypothetical protein
MEAPVIVKEAVALKPIMKGVGKVVSWPFKSRQVTGSAAKNLLKNKAMKEYYARAMKNNKFLSKGYFKEIAKDFSNPIQSLKRQYKLVNYGVKKGKIFKRSPLGKAYHAGIYGGVPLYYAGKSLAEKDKTSRNEVLAGAEIASMATPKIFPYMLLTEAPKLLYKKKKVLNDQTAYNKIR